MNILILGPVGSGKSTQADLLARELGVPHLSAGDLLHYVSEGDDKKAKIIREKMQKGELVEDETVVQVMTEQLRGEAYKNGVVVDGFPRNVKEAEHFTHPIDCVIYLQIPDHDVIARLSARGREDDTPEVIKKRLEIYHQETEPVLGFYKTQGVVEEIDGTRDIEAIFEEIKGRIKK